MKPNDNLADDMVAVFTLFHKHIMQMDSRSIDTCMSRSHFELLFMLNDTGPLPMSKIGERLFISKPYVTALVDKLTTQGLVERHPSSNDRRVTNIILTENGKEHLRDHKKLLRQSIQAKLSVLSEKEIEELSASLNGMRNILPKIKLNSTNTH